MKSLTDNLNLNFLELLSVLLPGGLMLTLLQKFDILQKFIALPCKEMKDLTWQEGFINFGISYFLGYTVYVGSTFLDHCYDSLKLKAVGRSNENDNGQKDKNENPIFLKKGNVKWWARYVILPYVHNTHNLINKVIILKVNYLGSDYEPAEPIDAFQWSYRFLMNKHDRMFSEVERYYSTAKFFRSMTLVFFISALFYICSDWNNFLIFMSLCILSFYLFLNRWQKTNHVAFKNVLILEKIINPINGVKRVSSDKNLPGVRGDNPTQTGV